MILYYESKKRELKTVLTTEDEPNPEPSCYLPVDYQQVVSTVWL